MASTNSSSSPPQKGEKDDSEISHIEENIWLDYSNGTITNVYDEKSNNTDGVNITASSSGTIINVYDEKFNNTDGVNITASRTAAPTSIIERIFNTTWPPDDSGINGTTTPGGYYGRPRPASPTIPPTWDGQFPPQQEQLAPFPQPNMIIVGVLIALIVVLGMVLGVVTIPPLINFFRRKIPVSQKRIDRRYATIDGWLITKVMLSYCCCSFCCCCSKMVYEHMLSIIFL